MAEYKQKILDREEIGRRIRLRRELFRLSRDRLAGTVEVLSQIIRIYEDGSRMK